MEQADRTTAHPAREKTYTGQKVLAGALEEEGANVIEICRGNKLKGAGNEGRICSAG